jgi:hypothetical protein
MTLNTAFVATRKQIRALVQAKRLPSTNCFYVFFSASAFHQNIFHTLAISIMTHFQAFVPTVHFFFANVITFWNNCATNDWWSQGSFSAWTWLGLTVNDWAFFAQTHVTVLSTSVFATIQHFWTGQFARMIFWFR